MNIVQFELMPVGFENYFFVKNLHVGDLVTVEIVENENDEILREVKGDVECSIFGAGKWFGSYFGILICLKEKRTFGRMSLYCRH